MVSKNAKFLKYPKKSNTDPNIQKLIYVINSYIVGGKIKGWCSLDGTS